MNARRILLVEDNPDDEALTLRALKKSNILNEVTVVILTSSGQEEDILEGYLGGANAYVRKPVAFAGLAEAVRALGMFWLLVNEQPVDALSPPPASDAPTLTATP